MQWANANLMHMIVALPLLYTNDTEGNQTPHLKAPQDR